MTRYHYFNAEFNVETVCDILAKIQESVAMYGTDTRIKLYVNTAGGMVESAFVFSDFLIGLNKIDGIPVEVVVCEDLNSSGIFFAANIKMYNDQSKEIRIPISVYGMCEAVLHEVGFEMHSRTPADKREKLLKEIVDRRVEALKFFKKHLSNKEIKEFNNSGEVVFDAKRLASILGAKVVNFF